MIPTSLNSLIISGKSGVSGPAGLSGKTVGTDGDPVSAQMLKAVLKKYNLSLNQIKLVTVNEGLVPAMVSNKVSAIISGYRNVEGIQLASLGLNPKVYPVAARRACPTTTSWSSSPTSPSWPATPPTGRWCKEFLAGLGQGAAAAQANPAAALAAITPVAKGYSPALLKQMVYATAPLLKNPAGFGAMSVGPVAELRQLDEERRADHQAGSGVLGREHVAAAEELIRVRWPGPADQRKPERAEIESEISDRSQCGPGRPVATPPGGGSRLGGPMTSAPVDGVEHRQLKDSVYLKLRQEIVSARLPPGYLLREAELAARFGVSKTPLREAFVRLEKDGFVEIAPYRSAVVGGYSRQDLREIYEVRELLEGLCAREAALNIATEDLATLSRIVRDSAAAFGAGDSDRLAALLDEFDVLLYAQSKNSRITAMLNNIRDHVTRIGRLTVAIPGRMGTSVREHQGIYEAIVQRDGQRAEALMRQHILSVMADQLANLDPESVAGRP